MLLTDEMKTYFEGANYALLCTMLDLGAGPEAVVLVKSTRDVVGGLKDAQASVRLAFKAADTEAGPVLCLALLAEHPEVGELFAESYFDVGDDADREALLSLGVQPRVKAAFFDEETHLAWLADVAWGDLECLVAEQTFDQAESWLEDAQNPDFDRARELFQEAVPFERLRELFDDRTT